MRLCHLCGFADWRTYTGDCTWCKSVGAVPVLFWYSRGDYSETRCVPAHMSEETYKTAFMNQVHSRTMVVGADMSHLLNHDQHVTHMFFLFGRKIVLQCGLNVHRAARGEDMLFYQAAMCTAAASWRCSMGHSWARGVARALTASSCSSKDPIRCIQSIGNCAGQVLVS